MRKVPLTVTQNIRSPEQIAYAERDDKVGLNIISSILRVSVPLFTATFGDLIRHQSCRSTSDVHARPEFIIA